MSFKINSLRTFQSAPGHRQSEAGASLLIVLLFSSIIGLLLFQFGQQNTEANKVARAEAAGWHLAEISRAARVIVRNNSFNDAADVNGDLINDNTYAKTVLDPNAAGPQEITVAQLIGVGLLPDDFAAINSFGQNIRIFAANHPVNGNPANDNTVASAYVFLEDSAEATPELMIHVVEQARRFGLTASAPVFGAANANLSDDCGGSPAVAIWDSDCLTLTEFQTVAGLDVTDPFVPGSLMVPAWRSHQHDTRAVMRFAQPENFGFATMLTNLNMGRLNLTSGDCADTDEIEFFETDGTTTRIEFDTTGICSVAGDVATAGLEEDNRVDLIGLAEMDVQRLVVANQAEDYRVELPGGGVVTPFSDDTDLLNDGADDNRISTNPNLNQVVTVNGNVRTGGNLTMTAQMNNPTGDPGIVGDDYRSSFHVAGALNVDHIVTVTDGDFTNGSGLSLLVNGVANSNSAVAETELRNIGPGITTELGTQDQTGALVSRTLDGQFSTMNVIELFGAGSSEGVIVNSLTATDQIITTETLDILGDAGIQDVTLSADGAGLGTFGVVAGAAVSGNNIVVTGNLGVSESIVVTNTGTIQGSTRIGQCFSNTAQCPNVTLDPQSPL